jgi:integrase
MPRGRALGPGRLYKRGELWALDWRDASGRRQHRSLSHDRRTAERIRSDLINKRDLELAGLGSEAGQGMPLAELVAAYLADLKPRVVPRHHEQVAARLAKVIAKLPDARVRDLRVASIASLRAEAVAAGVGNRSANLLADSVCACLRWGTDAGLIAANPLARLKRLPEAGHERRRRRALSDEEIARLLAAVEAEDRELALVAELDGRVRVPQRPLFEFLLGLGCRYGETRLLTWGCVDLQQRLVVLQAATTKSRRQRVLPLSDELVASLRALQAGLGRVPLASEPVFLTARGRPWCAPSNNLMRLLNRALARARIKRTDVEGRTVDLHALRHTAASRWARRGVPITVAQRMLGHQDVRLTAGVYTHVGVEELRGAVDSATGQGRRAESA